jgi:hypothetical protein
MKAERSEAPALATIDASVKKMVSSFTAKNKDMDERGTAMLDKKDVKIGLEREKVEAAKIEAQAGMVKSMNEAANIVLAKMTQEVNILMADMSTMDPLARAWHEMYCKMIGEEVMAAQVVAVASATPPVIAAEPPVVDAQPPVIGVEPDVMDVALPLTPFF